MAPSPLAFNQRVNMKWHVILPMQSMCCLYSCHMHTHCHLQVRLPTTLVGPCLGTQFQQRFRESCSRMLEFIDFHTATILYYD